MSSQADAIADSTIEQSDRLALRKALDATRRFKIALQIEWPCGHHRDQLTTHVIGGVAQCKRCRRRRWMHGFRLVCRRKEVQREIAEQRVLNGKKGGEVIAERLRAAMAELTIRPGNGRYPLDVLKRQIALRFGISPQALVGSCRLPVFIHARSVLAKILRERGLSYPQIGMLLGGRDHSTMIHSIERFDQYRRKNPIVEDAYLALRDER